MTNFVSKDKKFTLYHGDTFEILPNLKEKFDLIFAVFFVK